MDSITLPELKEEELRAYFQEHLDDPVGFPGRAVSCPITRFYREKYGLEVTTTRKKITLYCDCPSLTQRSELSLWSSRFTRIIDHWYSAHTMVTITGTQALKALDAAILEAKESEAKV